VVLLTRVIGLDAAGIVTVVGYNLAVVVGQRFHPDHQVGKDIEGLSNHVHGLDD
jgi:hypothetical protein